MGPCLPFTLSSMALSRRSNMLRHFATFQSKHVDYQDSYAYMFPPKMTRNT